MTARVISCNVGTPVTVDAGNRKVLTSIFKLPVAERVHVGRLNLEGDRQADLKVHGGLYKAVYGYPAEHYQWWREELGQAELPWGMFGENLTTEGLSEADVRIGDRFRTGSALLQVTQPRMPCFKLALKFGRPDMVKRFWASGRSGFYFSVAEEGELQAGDPMELVEQGPAEVSIARLVRLYRDREPDRDALEHALRSPLSPEWKSELRERLSELRA